LRTASAILAAALAMPAAADEMHYGLLRVRDLTPFGFLRLDMRPAHAVSAPPGSWGVEVELGYQNTWVLSPNVEQYLKSLPGRRRLGPAEIQAIRNLPGEAYLVDVELGVIDLTLHRKLTPHWGLYATLSGAYYGGGFLDGTVESFHDSFGLGSFGRPAVARNQVNVILDLKSTQLVRQDLGLDGGLLDPILGVRYTAVAAPATWNLVLESAVKLPIGGERPFLSTGRYDVGMQATLQRFMGPHAAYTSLAAVYTEGSDTVPVLRAQWIPTWILGYEYRMSDTTSLVAQSYVSPSVFSHQDTDLDGLLKTKLQFSLGARYRIGASLLSFAITENLGSFSNTPDIGFQLGWAYSSALAR
jgi:hypothetical protein